VKVPFIRMEEIFDIILSLDKRLNRAERAVSDLDTRLTKYSLQVGITKMSNPANAYSSEMTSHAFPLSSTTSVASPSSTPTSTPSKSSASSPSKSSNPVIKSTELKAKSGDVRLLEKFPQECDNEEENYYADYEEETYFYADNQGENTSSRQGSWGSAPNSENEKKDNRYNKSPTTKVVQYSQSNCNEKSKFVNSRSVPIQDNINNMGDWGSNWD